MHSGHAEAELQARIRSAAQAAQYSYRASKCQSGSLFYVNNVVTCATIVTTTGDKLLVMKGDSLSRSLSFLDFSCNCRVFNTEVEHPWDNCTASIRFSQAERKFALPGLVDQTFFGELVDHTAAMTIAVDEAGA